MLNRNSEAARTTPQAMVYTLALMAVLLLPAVLADSPTYNFTPQGAMQSNLNAGAHSVTNVASVLGTNGTPLSDTNGAAAAVYTSATNVAAADAATAQTNAVSTSETNASTLYIPLAGSTSITGNLGGANWEIVEATGAVSLAGGDFEVDASGNTITNGSFQSLSLLSAYGNQITDDGGNIYFGNNSGVALDNQGQVWWSAYNYSPTVLADNNNQLHYGDGAQMTTYDEVLYADQGAIVLGDGSGDGSASFGSAFFGGTISSYDWNITGSGIASLDNGSIQIGDGSGGGSASFANANLTISSAGNIGFSSAWNITRAHGIATLDGGSIILGDVSNGGSASFANGGLTISGAGTISSYDWNITGSGIATFSSSNGTIQIGGATNNSSVALTIANTGNVYTCGSIAPGNISTSGSHIWSGAGVPSSGLGINGDYYFRTDGSTGTHLYFKASGSWAGLL